jgi:hypothetical protein
VSAKFIWCQLHAASFYDLHYCSILMSQGICKIYPHQKCSILMPKHEGIYKIYPHQKYLSMKHFHNSLNPSDHPIYQTQAYLPARCHASSQTPNSTFAQRERDLLLERGGKPVLVSPISRVSSVSVNFLLSLSLPHIPIPTHLLLLSILTSKFAGLQQANRWTDEARIFLSHFIFFYFLGICLYFISLISCLFFLICINSFSICFNENS